MIDAEVLHSIETMSNESLAEDLRALAVTLDRLDMPHSSHRLRVAADRLEGEQQ